MLTLAEKQLDATEKASHLRALAGGAQRPPLQQIGDLVVPEAPANLSDVGIAPEILSDLLLKMAYSVASFTTDTAVKNLCLPTHIVNELVEQLRKDKLVEVLGEAGRFSYRLAITERGHARGAQLMEVSGYVGPAPVSLEEYSASLEWQLAHLPEVTPQEVAAAISELVLSDTAVQVAGLAGSSRRSLFLYGPPGNGKTTLGHLLHKALGGYIWVPRCLGVDSDMIVFFDPQTHEPAAVELPKEAAGRVDRRWVCIRRPFIVAAGELTLQSLELAYSPQRRYYEAPIHIKANGGTMLIDDFGRQRVEPAELLNRWMFPLENRVDYLTMQTGRKLRIPFRQMLVFSTNLDPDTVLDAGFLRRIGYRLRIGTPSAAEYAEIFRRYAECAETSVPPGLLAGLLARYQAERRPLRSCEPRDLIERARDICTYHGQALDLTTEIMDLAWRGYFGEQEAVEADRAERRVLA